jgi:hypothetical protein
MGWSAIEEEREEMGGMVRSNPIRWMDVCVLCVFV